MNDNPVQPDKDPAQPSPAPVQALSAVSPANKEQGPIEPFMQSSEVAVPSELKEFGVEVVNQHVPELPIQAHNAGVRLAGDVVPVPTHHSNLQIPTKEQAKKLSQGSTSDSETWLSKIWDKLFKKPQLAPQGGAA